jgi:hypothetical protein
MDLFIIRRPNAWANIDELKKTAELSARTADEQMSDRIRWIRSYVISEADGRIGTVCIYEAQDPGSIREHARLVGMPAEDILAVLDTVVVRADPAKAIA